MPDSPGVADPEPPELVAATRELIEQGRAGWRPTELDRLAAWELREVLGRIWAIDGSGWSSPAAVAEAAAAGVELLEDPEVIRRETAAAFTRVLDWDLSPQVRRLFTVAAQHEPQPCVMGNSWKIALGPMLTGIWSY